MKEDLKPLFELLKGRMEVISQTMTLEIKKLKTQATECIVKASFSKCYDYNQFLLDYNGKNSYFLMPTLRSITEELISLKFILEKYEGDKNDLLLHFANKNTAESIIAQEEFFKEKKPQQEVINRNILGDEIFSAEDKLKLLWKDHGLNGKSFPSVSYMATESKLIKLYNYLYAATSKQVHFNPHDLLRLGWTESMNEKPIVHTFSVKNFEKYYESFNLYYSAFLFVEMTKAFKEFLKLDREFIEKVKEIEKVINSKGRIPELVTFEEMNIKPSFITRILSRTYK
jgi:hypothetical protein